MYGKATATVVETFSRKGSLYSTLHFTSRLQSDVTAPTCHASANNTDGRRCDARSSLFRPIIDRFRKLNVMDAARMRGREKGRERKRERRRESERGRGGKERERERDRGFVSLWPRSRLSTSLLTSTIPVRLLRTAELFFPPMCTSERSSALFLTHRFFLLFRLFFSPRPVPFLPCPLQPITPCVD